MPRQPLRKYQRNSQLRAGQQLQVFRSVTRKQSVLSVEFLEANWTSRICWTGEDSLKFPPDKCLKNAICNVQKKIYKDYAYDDDGDDEESVIDDSGSNDNIPNQ